MGVLFDEACHVTGERTLEGAAEALAEQLIARCRLSDGPIDLDRVCGELGVVKVEYRSLPCDGVLLPLTSGYKVMIANWAPKTRQRFSLAHELGHVMVHSLLPETTRAATRSVFTPPGHAEEERFCDLFASRLLMPRRVVDAAMSRGLGLVAIRDLALGAGASLSAAARRLSEALKINVGLATVVQKEDRLRIGRVLLSSKEGKRVGQGPLKDRGVCATAVRERRHLCGWEWIPVSETQRTCMRVECEGWGTTGCAPGGIVLCY